MNKMHDGQTVEGTWHGERVSFTLSPAFVRKVMDDTATEAHLERLEQSLTATLAELMYYGSSDEWAGLNIPAEQLALTTRTLKAVRGAVSARRQQLATDRAMLRHVLGKSS